MSKRRYSNSELETMRSALRFKREPDPMVPFRQEDIDLRVELELQTHVLNETEPQDLVKETDGQSWRS